MNDRDDEPIEREPALLPREELGPFLLLGVDKDADPGQIEASRDQRLAFARENPMRVSPQDVHWAGEVLNDPARRVKADVTSLNTDTAERTVRGLEESFGLAGPSPAWQPLDAGESPAPDFPGAEIPDPEMLRQAIPVPPLPRDVPAVARLLEHFARRPLDPWDLE